MFYFDVVKAALFSSREACPYGYGSTIGVTRYRQAVGTREKRSSIHKFLILLIINPKLIQEKHSDSPWAKDRPVAALD